nr:hypothetical protein [uncultured Chryseobacterium sp.]
MRNLRNFLPALFLIVHSLVQGQIKANISSDNYDLQSVDINIGKIIIQLSNNGRISGFQPVDSDGAVDYYDSNFEAYRFAKLKTIANLKIDYWDVLDKSDLRYGKIKNIGTVTIEYYDSFDKEKYGKVKKIGDLQIDYWESSIVDDSRLGKLKSVGSVLIDFGLKEIVGSANYRKLTRFGSVYLEYWNDTIFDKDKYGKLRLIKGNTKDVSVSIVW